MTMRDVLDQLAAHDRCATTGHPDAHWVQRINSNGARSIEFFCPNCERPITAERYGTKGHAVSADWVRTTLQLDPAEFPEWRRGLRYQLCYLCSTTALCELHHVAPQAIYGKDADRWPIVPLCADCHQQQTKDFTERLERYVAERIRRYLAKQGGSAA